MRMDRMGAEGPVISGFSAGGFVVDDGVYPALVISPVRADSWSPPPIAALGEGDLATLLAIDPQPEFLLLGTGSALVRPPAAFTQALAVRGIGVEVMDSRAAARAWGMLRGEQRWIAGALYPLEA
ncbi:Mth938-like domain-containing protein [Stakelama tenebrarum]|uniref:Xcc1710-like domain-containing protein n=1 Tax=Stakelama tenebrarum TaxID=2711215 RepID=A0A6G6Y441_9SPHN|nr:Mth938-like domain-containing protein [Sphingosinithalassobacter tenebrarum]QIG79336.1 hypothetical protein G5C33_05710 [Sphingosinithalassobacter tenebrarum]